MKIQIRGANRFEVTDAIKNYIEDKVGSLQRFLPTNQNLEARVYIKIYDVIKDVPALIMCILSIILESLKLGVNPTSAIRSLQN